MGTTSDRARLSPLLVVGAFLPALVAVVPLTAGPVGYLAAEENQRYLSTGRVLWMLTSFAVAVSPFIGSLTAVLSARALGASWTLSCRIAATCAFALGCLSVVWLGLYSGGF